MDINLFGTQDSNGGKGVIWKFNLAEKNNVILRFYILEMEKTKSRYSNKKKRKKIL